MRHTLIRAAIGVAMFSSVCLVSAQDATTPPAADVSKIAKYRSAPLMQASQSKKLVVNSATAGGVTSAEAFANPYRAYPPSCLEAPLLLGLYANDPGRLQTQITLPGDPLNTANGENTYSETDTVTVFRAVCSSGVSATLLEIDRPSGSAAFPYPVFPGIYIGSQQYVPRITNDPNTFFTNTFAYDPVTTSDVYVLEHIYGESSIVDYNQAFTLYVDNLMSGSNADTAQFDLPAYNPANYAEASQPLKISGYMTGNWYDPAHNGEGLQVEVGEFTYPTRYMTIAWYTYDEMGVPYWLVGSGSFTAGDRTASVTLGYTSGGGFAGNFGSSVTSNAWGSFTASFPDCNTMVFTYASLPGTPSTIPVGNNTNNPKTWTRLSQMNGLTCE